MYKELNKYLIKLGVYDEQDRVDIIHDVLLNNKAVDKEFFYAKKRALNLFKRKKIDRDRYISLNSSLDQEDEVKLENVLSEETENEKNTKLLERQRQLIKFLVDGADSRTLMIVEAFLCLDKPTMNSVAKELCLNHNQVNRSLKRLSKNYDSEIFGSIDSYMYS